MRSNRARDSPADFNHDSGVRLRARFEVRGRLEFDGAGELEAARFVGEGKRFRGSGGVEVGTLTVNRASRAMVRKPGLGCGIYQQLESLRESVQCAQERYPSGPR